MTCRLIAAGLLGGSLVAAWAQSPDAVPPAASPAPAAPPAAQKGFLGSDVPAFDPGSEVMTWDGKIWNIQDQRVFRARFEKYLNAEEESGAEAKKYRDQFKEMLDLLSPAKMSKENFRKAWAILPSASSYEPDAELCNSLDDAIFGVLLAQQEVTRIDDQNRSLVRRKDTLEWNSRFAADSSLLGPAPKNPAAAEQWNREQNLKRDMKMQPLLTELGEVNASIAGNRVKKEALRLQAKIEFQVLIAQLFLQRRFEHVLLANRFYRALFGDGDNQLRVADDYAANQSAKNKESFGDLAKLPKTLGQLDALANEAIRDVREGVESFSFLLEKSELKSAAERLSEAFAVGEYLPEIRLLIRAKKRSVLEFTRKSNQLLSALEVKDYERASTLVKELETTSQDFGSSRGNPTNCSPPWRLRTTKERAPSLRNWKQQARTLTAPSRWRRWKPPARSVHCTLPRRGPQRLRGIGPPWKPNCAPPPRFGPATLPWRKFPGLSLTKPTCSSRHSMTLSGFMPRRTIGRFLRTKFVLLPPPLSIPENRKNLNRCSIKYSLPRRPSCAQPNWPSAGTLREPGKVWSGDFPATPMTPS